MEFSICGIMPVSKKVTVFRILRILEFQIRDAQPVTQERKTCLISKCKWVSSKNQARLKNGRTPHWGLVGSNLKKQQLSILQPLYKINGMGKLGILGTVYQDYQHIFLKSSQSVWGSLAKQNK